MLLLLYLRLLHSSCCYLSYVQQIAKRENKNETTDVCPATVEVDLSSLTWIIVWNTPITWSLNEALIGISATANDGIDVALTNAIVVTTTRTTTPKTANADAVIRTNHATSDG